MPESPFYKAGQSAALRVLNLLRDDRGSPYPEKELPTAAEMFARHLQNDDDQSRYISPDNTDHVGRLERPASWGSPSQIDENQPNGSIMLPSNVKA